MGETSSSSPPALVGAPKRFARRLLAYGENRVELLLIELEEERRHFLRMLLLAIGAAVLALLAGMGFTAAIVVAFWQLYPITVLLVLAASYAVGAVFLYRCVLSLQRDWKMLSATLEQLQKDGECLKEMLA